ncbi:hypothetical protein KIPB_008602, partial [Kipferlia bialata]
SDTQHSHPRHPTTRGQRYV